MSEGAALPSVRPNPFDDVKPRVWPAAVILALMWLAIASTFVGEPGFMAIMTRIMLAPFLALLAILIWWLSATRLPWFDTLLVLAFVVVSGSLLLVPHGKDAMMYALAVTPYVVTAWAGWLTITPFLTWNYRLVGLLACIAAATGFWSLIRIDGVDGDFVSEYHWRWTPTAEAKFMAEKKEERNKLGDEVKLVKPADVKVKPGDWAAFRGPNRDSRVQDVVIGTDWKNNPPKVLWKHRIGPGWSSFAVVGSQLYTQEQRDEDEMVVCYNADTGAEVWSYAVPTRFTEAIAGAGPRATPTYHEGKIFSQGANGHLICLDAFTGKELWKKEVNKDTDAPTPQWGFSGSPLVHKGIVSVYAGAKDKTLVGYKVDTGELAWVSSRETPPELSYCSTHLANIDGVDQLLILSDRGGTAYNPETGELIWEHLWETGGVVRCVQPALIDGSDFLIGTGLGVGTQRVHIEHKDGKWTPTEVWKTTQFKPYYNDLVIYEGFAYGYDNNFFCCVDLKDGKIKWKARGYGSGQALLLAKQGLLVILTEKGEVALVEAKPQAHKELGKIKAIEGKTWNHPVIANGKLFIRNGEEIACLELPKPTDGLAKDGK